MIVKVGDTMADSSQEPVSIRIMDADERARLLFMLQSRDDVFTFYPHGTPPSAVRKFEKPLVEAAPGGTPLFFMPRKGLALPGEQPPER